MSTAETRDAARRAPQREARQQDEELIAAQAQRCTCPTDAAHGQMVPRWGPLASDAGAPEGLTWRCATCGIERMWPDAPGE